MSAADTGRLAIPITALPLAACFEFVAHPGTAVVADAISAWPGIPGQVLWDGSGRPALLHFAPDRWLAPAPAPALLRELTSLARGGCGVLIEVEGKWQEVRIAAAHARRILSASIDVETVLAGRECAAILLFDCPAILARHDGAFNLWIAASFVQSLVAVSAVVPNPDRGAFGG
jgi:sarcosine oxidase gamma subunit